MEETNLSPYIVLRNQIRHDISESIELIIRCDKFYLNLMETRLKIQNEQANFLHRLSIFRSSFLKNRIQIIQFQKFAEAGKDIFDGINLIEYEFHKYQNNVEETFIELHAQNAIRSLNLRQIKRIHVNTMTYDELSNVQLPEITTLENIFSVTTKKLECDWYEVRHFGEQKLKHYTDQLTNIYKELKLVQS